jgi:hypothetical protein
VVNFTKQFLVLYSPPILKLFDEFKGSKNERIEKVVGKIGE